MAKKKRKRTLTPEQREQRETLSALQSELIDLHEISLLVMADQGVLPPLYGGDYLEEDREVIPLWGMNDDTPELGALILRVMPDVEPDPQLDEAREEIGLINDWPISDLLEMLKLPDGASAVDGADEISNLSMIFMLMGPQINPAPGYD